MDKNTLACYNGTANKDNLMKEYDIDNLPKTDKEFAAANIVSHVREIQDERALKGDFVKSYSVKSDQGNVKYITADKFGVNPDDEETLKTLLGKNFGELIVEKVTVTLKEEIFADEKKQEELMELLREIISCILKK